VTAVLARFRESVVALVLAVELVLGLVSAMALVILTRGPTGPVTIRMVAAGDMACDPDDPDFLARSDAEGDHCRQDDVSTIAAELEPNLFLGLGDYQYELPTRDAYRDVYGPSWGRLRKQTVPVLGNQEYKVHDATTFRDYFGDRVRDPRGYWSQDVGSWHLVVLNSNCSSVAGGCGLGSPQQVWLDADLAKTRKHCVLAAWHHPRWSSGIVGPDDRTKELFRTLYNHGVEMVLSGHEADYERFGPLDPSGKPDPAGVRQFVVGTGGQAHYEPVPEDSPWRGTTTVPRSEYVDYNHHGVLELDLGPGRWQWRFHALDAEVADQGEGRCG
jgi:hypothetical protein